MNSRLIGIYPPAAASCRKRLLAAFEQLLPVRFEGREAGAWDGLGALVRFGDMPNAYPEPPCPTLVITCSELTTQGAMVRFTEDPGVDARLRGRGLFEREAPLGSLRPEVGDQVLAVANGPVWLRRACGQPLHQELASPVTELGEGQILRDRLRDGSFLPGLVLLHFLREATRELAFTSPARGALLMIDDPNLHARSYGFVDFSELAAHAREYDYTVAMAMAAIDGWMVQGTARRCFAEHPDHMSLLMHGNNHEHLELLRRGPTSWLEADIAQGLRRIASFERRSGLSVSRVMCPPHGFCSEESIAVMLRLGVEGVLASQTFPWPPGRPPAGWTISECEPAQLLAGGLPVVPRHWLSYSWDDLVLRAFLGLPIIVGCHHDDLADGLGPLDDAAALIGGLPGVAWTSATDIFERNHETRREGRTLRLRLFALTARIDIPAGVDELQVEIPRAHGAPRELTIRAGAQVRQIVLSDTSATRTTLPVSPGPVTVAVSPSSPLDMNEISPPSRRPRPILRRAATETRDRITPVIRSARGSSRVDGAPVWRPDPPGAHAWTELTRGDQLTPGGSTRTVERT